MHKSQAGFDPPPVDDTSHEADALPTTAGFLTKIYKFVVRRFKRDPTLNLRAIFFLIFILKSLNFFKLSNYLLPNNISQHFIVDS